MPLSLCSTKYTQTLRNRKLFVNQNIQDWAYSPLIVRIYAQIQPWLSQIKLSKKFKIKEKGLDEVAVEIANALRTKTSTNLLETNKLEEIRYGSITAVRDQFDIQFEGQLVTIRHTIGIMPTGHIVTMMATTPLGQIDAIEFMLNKIYSNLKES